MFDRACVLGVKLASAHLWAPTPLGGDQVLFACANQIPASHLVESLAEEGPVGPVVVAQESFVQSALIRALGDATCSLVRLMGPRGFFSVWYMAVA